MAQASAELKDDQARGHMKRYFDSLSDKDRRRHAAVAAVRSGRGGSKVARFLGCSTRTTLRGIAEVDSLGQFPAAGRVRRPGAGPKKYRT